MKLTGLLKEKVDAVETKEEKKALISEAGFELSDAEVEAVVGGTPISPARTICKVCLRNPCQCKK